MSPDVKGCAIRQHIKYIRTWIFAQPTLVVSYPNRSGGFGLGITPDPPAQSKNNAPFGAFLFAQKPPFSLGTNKKNPAGYRDGGFKGNDYHSIRVRDKSTHIIP